MKRIIALLLIILMCISQTSVFAAGKSKNKQPGIEVKKTPATKVTVLALADKYIKLTEPKLEDEDKETIKALKYRLDTLEKTPAFKKDAINDFVNGFTIALMGAKSFKGITVAAGYLVKYSDATARTSNLFAGILHTTDKFQDAATVTEYILSLEPKNDLAHLNLANIYLDLNRDEAARKIAEKIIFEDSENRDAWKLMAGYWYKKNNLARFREALLRAAKFKGFVKKKTDKKRKPIDDNEPQESDTKEVLDTKTDVLKESIPITTADLIEEEYPAQAQQIRDRYGKLIDNEKMKLPLFPQIKVNSNQDYIENFPIIEEWISVFVQKQSNFINTEYTEANINQGDSEAVKEAKAKEAGKKMMEKAFSDAQAQMKFLKNMKGIKGINQNQIDAVMKQMQKVAKQQGVKIKDKPIDMSVPPGFDNGSPLVLANYSNYLVIVHAYDLYFHKYYKEFQPKVMDIIKVYNQKIEEENKHHKEIMDKLQQAHNQDPNPHGDSDVPCKKEILRHKKQLNEIGNNYYKQWVNLYLPQYTQKMKPKLEEFWYVSGLYLKNMNDPDVMKKEYLRVKNTFYQYATMAATQAGYGSAFKYEGSTEEEEEALRQAIEAAKEEGQEKKPEYEKQYETVDNGWSKWIEDHLVLEISGQFLSFKITAKTIEFEAWAMGPTAGIKINLVDEKVETYAGVGAKLKVGANIGGLEAKIDVKADLIRKDAKWDFENGTYEESYGGKLKASGKLLGVSVSSDAQYDTELNFKGSSKVNAGNFTYQEKWEDKAP